MQSPAEVGRGSAGSSVANGKGSKRPSAEGDQGTGVLGEDDLAPSAQQRRSPVHGTNSNSRLPPVHPGSNLSGGGGGGGGNHYNGGNNSGNNSNSSTGLLSAAEGRAQQQQQQPLRLGGGQAERGDWEADIDSILKERSSREKKRASEQSGGGGGTPPAAPIVPPAGSGGGALSMDPPSPLIFRNSNMRSSLSGALQTYGEGDIGEG